MAKVLSALYSVPRRVKVIGPNLSPSIQRLHNSKPCALVSALAEKPRLQFFHDAARAAPTAKQDALGRTRKLEQTLFVSLEIK